MGFFKKALRALDNLVFRTDRFMIGLVKSFFQRLQSATSQHQAVRLFRWLVIELKAIGKDLDDLLIIIDREAMACIRDLCRLSRAFRTV